MKKENPSFSPREREVIALVLQGQSNKQIAFTLGIAVRTVEFHLKNIYTKQQVGSRVELILALDRAVWGPEPAQLGESTVASRSEEVHNGTLKSFGHRWETTLKIIFVLIEKELAMTKKQLLEKIENFVGRHPLVLGTLLLLLVCLGTRYLLMTIGVYFWLSYLLLGLMLSSGSLTWGWSIQHNTPKPMLNKPFIMLGSALLLIPVLIALLDFALLHTAGKLLGTVSTNLVNLSHQAIWRMNSLGQAYLYRESWIRNDHLWLGVTFSMFLLYGLSIWVRTIKSGKG